MMIGIIGRMRSGKTLLQTILAEAFSEMTGMQIYSNYYLKNSIAIESTKDIWKLKQGILCFDEIWMTLDSRFWKDNASLTYWIMQTGKRGMLVFYTAQNKHQIEKRVRDATDIFVLATKYEKDGVKGHKYTFLEPDLMEENVFKVGRSYYLTKPSEFYYLYDTYQLMWPVRFEAMSIQEMKNLS